MAWSGVSVFLYDDEARTLTPVTTYPASDLPVTFYEVSVVEDAGSWWQPAAPRSDGQAHFDGSNKSYGNTSEKCGSLFRPYAHAAEVQRPQAR